MASAALLDARYVLLEAVGRGGMGRVFRAFDRDAERVVALKLVEGREPGAAHPIAEEFRAWARLRHPNVVRALELARARSGPLAPGTPYLVLEYVDGAPAHKVLVPGRVPPEALERLAKETLDALDHVHASGFVHRDLKPGNVLLTRGSRPGSWVKLTDFGLAAPWGVTRAAGCFSGSIPYLAPEAIAGRSLDGRVDLYALGLLLHFLACGRLPFDARDTDAALRWHLDGPPVDAAALERFLPPRLARFVERLTARDRESRPGSAAAALDEISGGAWRPRPPVPVARRGALATMRLALDAARLGAWRRVGLPPGRLEAALLVDEAVLLSQVHGLDVMRLRGGARARSELGRAVLRRLIDAGPDARSLAARHGLDRRVPLEFFGGLPVWDRTRAERSTAVWRPAVLAVAASGLADFLVETFRTRRTLLVAEAGALADPLTREVIFRLEGEAERRGAPLPGPGGLLLLVQARTRGQAAPASHRRAAARRMAPAVRA